MRRLAGALGGAVGLTVLAAAIALANPTPLAQLGGTEGDDAGELDNPSGSAVDAAGSVYAVDTSNYRVSVFDRKGNFLRAFGKDVVPGGGSGPEVCTTSCQAGDGAGGAGSLAEPYGIAVTPAGDLIVADFSLDRITVWTPSGNLVRTFGAEGDGVGEFDGLIGIAPVGDGSFFVAEYNNNRVSVVTPEGDFKRAFGAGVVPGGADGPEVCTTSCQAGVVTTGLPGELSHPTGAASDDAGNVFVGEQGGNRVSAFTAAGAFLRAFGKNVVPGDGTGSEVCTTSCQFGSSGDAPGELSSPDALALDGAGDLHVGDQDNNSVSVFTASGSFVHAYGQNVIPGGGSGFEVCTLSCQSGTPSTQVGALASPFVAGFDCRGAVYIGDQGNARIQRFGEPRTKKAPCPLKLGKAKKNKHKGTAKLNVKVPEPGPLKLVLSGKGLKKAKKKSVEPGKTKLKVRTKGAARDELERLGELKVKVKVKGKPRSGKAQKKSKKLKLVLNG
jgi:tripartite motif-containing protein 71